MRQTVILAAVLSIVAAAAAVGAFAVVLTRGSGTQQAGQDDSTVCRTVAWNALPSVSALPPGWAIVSSRFLVGILTTTLAGPVPSGATQGPAAFVSVSCYGSDATLVLARDHEAALGAGAGATDLSFPNLGDESVAVTSPRTSSTTVYIRRGVLVADITAATSLDQAVLQTVAGAVDEAMLGSLSGSPRPSTTAAAGGSGIPSPAVSPGPSTSIASPSPSAAAVSHVAPDLEAHLPSSVAGTGLSSESVVGTTALGNDTTSQSLIASLEKLGKTSADLQIAEAHDPTGTLAVRLFCFRANGVPASDLAAAIVDSWMAGTLSSPNRSDVTIAGQKLSRVAYSQGPADYVFARGGVVFDIETTDESLVSKLVPLLN